GHSVSARSDQAVVGAGSHRTVRRTRPEPGGGRAPHRSEQRAPSLGPSILTPSSGPVRSRAAFLTRPPPPSAINGGVADVFRLRDRPGASTPPSPPPPSPSPLSPPP